MTPDRASALYRRLRPLFPKAWRIEHEHDFIATLRASVRTDAPGHLAHVADLLTLAVVLRWRQLARHAVRIPTLGPAAATLTFALLLLAPVLRWSGEVSIEFVVTTLLVVAVPGIGVLYTVSCALAGGRGRGLIAAIGCTLGIVPHLVVAFLGLSGLMQLGATLFETVRWAGVAYLAWMGVMMLRSAGTARAEDDASSPPPDAHVASSPTSPGEPDLRDAFDVIVRGVLLNLLNPKLTLFFFAFLPQFLSSAGGDTVLGVDPRLIGLGSLFMVLTLAGFVLYALAGAAARAHVARSPRAMGWAQRSIGALLLGFATRLAFSER